MYKILRPYFQGSKKYGLNKYLSTTLPKYALPKIEFTSFHSNRKNLSIHLHPFPFVRFRFIEQHIHQFQTLIYSDVRDS